jgi:hypothetical protein
MSSTKDKIKKRGRPKKKDIPNSIVKTKSPNVKVTDSDSESDEIIVLMKNVKISNIISDEEEEDIFNLDDFDISENSDDEKISISMTEKMKEYEKKIASLEAIVENYKKIIDNGKFVIEYTKSFSKILDLKLFDCNTGKAIALENIPKKRCWWCTYDFLNFPCIIVSKIHNNEYHVFGYFCTPNCAVSYNLGMTDYKKHDRHTLICKLYSEITGQSNLVITPAPDRIVLEGFGGFVTIDEYRSSSIKGDIEYKLIMPPMKSIYPIIECYSKEYSTKSENDLVIKRSKPLPQSKSTFQNRFTF